MNRRQGPTVSQQREASFTLCRTFGHSWDHLMTTTNEWGADVITLRCTRCTMSRVDAVAPGTGELLHRLYDAPDGYATTERMTRSEWRTRFLKSLLK